MRKINCRLLFRKMNISNIKENFNYMSYCGGISVSPQEATMIENSLIILKSNNKFNETYLWGRITGVKNDYYIAYGYQKNCLSGSKYFYSINCPGQWILLPTPVPNNNRLCLLNQNLFQGDVTAVDDVVMVHVLNLLPSHLHSNSKLFHLLFRFEIARMTFPRRHSN